MPLVSCCASSRLLTKGKEIQKFLDFLISLSTVSLLMQYTSSSRYALRALIHMAEAGTDRTHSLETICRDEKLPRAFINKIFKRLVDKKILKSLKGPGGGYQFLKPPEQLTLYEIKVALDGEEDFTACALGLDHCSDQTPCSVHEFWKEIRVGFINAMQGTNLKKASELVARKRAAGSAP